MNLLLETDKRSLFLIVMTLKCKRLRKLVNNVKSHQGQKTNPETIAVFSEAERLIRKLLEHDFVQSIPEVLSGKFWPDFPLIFSTVNDFWVIGGQSLFSSAGFVCCLSRKTRELKG